jgi:hypothetical protein
VNYNSHDAFLRHILAVTDRCRPILTMDGTCSAIDSLQDRRDTESVRAIVANSNRQSSSATVSTFSRWVPMHVERRHRSPISTYIYDFKGGQVELQTYIEKTRGSRAPRRTSEAKSYSRYNRRLDCMCCIELGCSIAHSTGSLNKKKMTKYRSYPIIVDLDS